MYVCLIIIQKRNGLNLGRNLSIQMIHYLLFKMANQIQEMSNTTPNFTPSTLLKLNHYVLTTQKSCKIYIMFKLMGNIFPLTNCNPKIHCDN
jgi:hypothetical protein